MTQATIEQFAKDVNGYLSVAQKGRLLVTSRGQPVALVIGLENKDAEDFHYMTSPDFWRLIEQTRQMPTLPLEQVKAELFGEEEESTKFDPSQGS
jgi:hypothetical protein